MSSLLSPWGPERSGARPDRKRMYVRLHGPTLFVRDMDRSLAFYADKLGFAVAVDTRQKLGRWAAVVPPYGTGIIALAEPAADSEEYQRIGRSSQIILLTEDVVANFNDWIERGVRFQFPPRAEPWGGVRAGFEDPDGNSFFLISFDEASRQIEAQRRAAYELEIARQVQARLFPQTSSSLRTLEYAGICLQARAVGGDYYDFLEFSPGRVGLIVGDIAGKGMGAALLMASLHASLRSQSATALDDPQKLLRSVNQFFYKNTADGAYATLFFSEYDDESRRLRYVNCGHWPALLLRRNGHLEQLHATSTPLGLFEEWDCAILERQLSPGDVLALYSDGVTESLNAAGEEFGASRLIENLRRSRDLSSEAWLTSMVSQIRQFSPNEQRDDITLVIAKSRLT